MAGETFTIEITGLDELPDTFMAAARRGAISGIQEALLLLERTVKFNIERGRDVKHYGPAMFTHTLHDHIAHSISESEPYNVEGFVGVGPEAQTYALTLEEGRTPGARMPKSDYLIPWVEEKLGVTGTESHIRGVAFVVSRAIGREGFPGVHMFRNAFMEQEQNVVALVRQHINRALAEEFAG